MIHSQKISGDNLIISKILVWLLFSSNNSRVRSTSLRRSEYPMKWFRIRRNLALSIVIPMCLLSLWGTVVEMILRPKGNPMISTVQALAVVCWTPVLQESRISRSKKSFSWIIPRSVGSIMLIWQTRPLTSHSKQNVVTLPNLSNPKSSYSKIWPSWNYLR